MISHTTERFRKAFQRLPAHIQRNARKSYRLWKDNPYHPSLHFKKVHSIEPVYSVRVAIGWRPFGTKTDDAMVWFWIGDHAEYERILLQL